MPGKSGANDRVQVRTLSPPTEPLRSEARIRDEDRRVACSSGAITPGHSSPADRLGRGDHLSHRMTSADPKVQRRAFASGVKLFERAQMCVGKILDVNVIADAGTVCSRIIDAVDLDVRSLSEGRLQHQWDEVCFGLVTLADLAIGIGSGGIEIPERNRADAISLSVPTQRPLDCELSLAVGVHRELPSRLTDRIDIGQAVGGACRRKDDFVYPGLAHRL